MPISDVIAFVGTGLAATSVGWQVATYRQGGAKVQLSSRLALSGPEYKDVEDSDDAHDSNGEEGHREADVDDEDQSTGEAISRGAVSIAEQAEPFDIGVRPLPHNPLLIATLRNRGQTSIQVLSCDLRIQISRSSRRKQTWIDFNFGSPAAARGVSALGDGIASIVDSPALPYVLPPNSRTEWALPILSLLPMVHSLKLERSPATLDVSFGNGRRKRIKVDVPSALDFEGGSDA
jgi:hypothetical protein